MTLKQSSFKRIPWIFFDLDDTLWNFSSNSAIALRKLYEISPILRKLFKNLEEFVAIYHAHNGMLWPMYGRGEITAKELKVERWRRTLATRQFEVLTAVCEELERNYLDILTTATELMPGAVSLLMSLRKSSMIGILSNGFLYTQYKKLYNSGLDRFVNRMILSDEIGINKPDSRIFDYAVAETGASFPLLMVGDNAETDILGAMRAGWNAIWINPAGNPFPFSDLFLEKEGINPGLLIGSVTSLDEACPLIGNFIENR